jgi:Ricin-type beta-trefoil lectin domain
LTGVTEQPPTRPGDPQSGPELEFLRRWRPLIDRVGGDGGQARAAKHMNWTTSTVSRDYKGNTLPTDERLHQLCSALQLSPNETLDLALLLRRARSARRSRGRESAQLTATAPPTSSPGAGPEADTGQPRYQPGHVAPRRWDGLRDRLLGRRGRVAAGAGAVGVVGLAVVIAVAFGLFGSGAAGAGKPVAQTKTPGSADPTAQGAFSGLALEAVTIPVRSLSPTLAGAFRQGVRTAHDSTITGFVFRNRGDTGLCLSAADTGPTAGQNHDPVLVSACRRAANEIWIPEQWETNGFTFTHLVNDQYQTMCLNADKLGGLSNGHIVQLWDCYPAGNEMWDFGDWHRAVSTRTESYPLFARSGRLCLDADKYDLRVGTPVRVWTQYVAANQFWS